jgi:hypothetical protein
LIAEKPRENKKKEKPVELIREKKRFETSLSTNPTSSWIAAIK